MVQGIVRRHKRYVKVIAAFEDDGRITPLSVVWDNGRSFDIDHVWDARRATSLTAGGTGMRYPISILGKDTYLYFEDPRWFVEEKVVEMP
jgi:hypothetical protein